MNINLTLKNHVWHVIFPANSPQALTMGTTVVPTPFTADNSYRQVRQFLSHRNPSWSIPEALVEVSP